MGYEEDYKYYLTFERRELQTLCRNNRLPANRSHAELADLLASFYAKKNQALNFEREKTINGIYKRPRDSEDLSKHHKDFVEAHGKTQMEHMSKESENNQQFSTGISTKFGSHAELQASANVFASEQSNNSTSLTGEVEDIDELKKYSDLRKKRKIATLNRAASKIDSTVPKNMPRAAGSSKQVNFGKNIPSFEFFRSCESGIDLHVDLNSNPLEWINSLKDEVHNNLNKEDLNPSRFCIHPGSSSSKDTTHMEKSHFENIEHNPNLNTDCTISTLSSQNESNKSIVANVDATVLSSDSSELTPSVALSISPINQKRVASAIDIFVAPLSDMSMLSTKEATDQAQMICPTLKIDTGFNDIEISPICNPIGSIANENQSLEPFQTEVTELTSVLSNGEVTDAIGKSYCGEKLVAKPVEVITEQNGSSNFCDVHLTSTDCLLNSHEQGKSTKAEKEKISERTQSQNFFENLSKSSHSLEANDSIQIERRLSAAPEKSEAVVNLRSARTSAEENVVLPRRSSRLLEVKFK